MNPPRIPIKLGRSPLLEVLFEVRFSPSIATAGDILPGILYPSLRDQYPEVEALPTASVPRSVRGEDPNLVYLASHRLIGGMTSVQLGDRVVVLSTIAYPGWEAFLQRINGLLRALADTRLVKAVERFSFRYVNIIPAPEADNQLSLLAAKIELMGAPPSEYGFILRSEYHEEPFITIMQIKTRATATLPNGDQIKGLLIDVDTLMQAPPPRFFEEAKDAFVQAHDTLKKAFFSVLKPETLERMLPEWSDG